MTHTKPHVAVPQSDEVSARGLRVQHGAPTNRRTGAVKLAARFLTAMAIVSLAMMYIATRDQLPDASAATGTINALNVGTCYATDETAFVKAECMDGSNAAYEVAGRKDVTKATPLYATYPLDPKTTSENPRAIVYNGDLIKIRVKDDGRDKRTGVLYAVTQDGTGGTITARVNGLANNAAYTTTIRNSVGREFQDGSTSLELASTAAYFEISGADGNLGTHVTLSGIRTLNWRQGTETVVNPIAPIHDNTGHGMKTGRVKLFGFIQDFADTVLSPTAVGDFQDLTSRITLDEDYGCIPDPTRTDPDFGCRGKSPWFDAQFRVDDGKRITVMYVYYETSEQEEIVGGKKRSDYLGIDANSDGDTTDEDDTAASIAAEAPAFIGDEDPSNAANQKAILASVAADGQKETRNLWFKETGRFTGTYVGYVRLTDANGNGSEVGEVDPKNWGRQVRDAVAPTASEEYALPSPSNAAVIGVESGPLEIKYRDTDEDDQTLKITIDKVAPSITIDSPLDLTSTRDASPNMSGSFQDGGSGLRKDSFKLFADNKDDGDEDGDAGTPVFDLKVYENPVGLLDYRGMVDEPTGQLEIVGNYVGYRNQSGQMDSPFGIVKAAEVYHAESGTTSQYMVRVDGTNTPFDRYKVIDADDYDDGDADGEFDASVRFDFSETLPNETFNNTIDYQAVVMDRAGNLGFSDSEPSQPRFIHEYGVKSSDRKKDKHNVLGWYSRHILFLDLVDPEVREDESATGFYGMDDDDPIVSDSGVMVVFDKPVSSSGINTSTFEVTLDDGTEATVSEVKVEGKRVFLLLEDALAANATPKVDLASGEVIRDLAGNSTLPREFDEIDVSDGILPTFTVTLSGGSGLLAPDYGPDKITKEFITITITSNEMIQGAPKFTVLCENFTWHNAEATTEDQRAEQRESNNIAKYVSNRTGSMSTGMFANAEPTDAMISQTMRNCEYTFEEGEDDPNPEDIAETTALSRGANRDRWEYRWSNLDDLLDGKLTVVVTGRDIGGFRWVAPGVSETRVNYGTATAEFTLDTELKSPTKPGGGRVIPASGAAVSEPRPFVMIEFTEKPPVTVTKFEVDNEDVLSELETLDDNRFVYWPDADDVLDIGNYTVKVEANDVANNTTDFQYKFSVRDRLPFTLNLLAGWNTISFPANPQDRALHAVFTEPEIDQVISWDGPSRSWRAATRVDGVWTTGEDYAVLNDIEARNGYWVHSRGFVTQTVKLVPKGDRIGPLFTTTVDIPTQPRGWNFIGVVDVDGDQTEDNAGQTLLNSKKAPVSASQYLGDYRNAYTWDNINNKWQRMRPDGPVTIGTGIWVYYDKGGDIAP